MINVRTMQKKDVKAVAKIEQECFSRPWSEQAFSDTLQQPEALFVVACEEAKILGYCGMYVTFDEGEITNVAVAQYARGKQIGISLLQTLCQKAKERGVTRILLEVRVSNAAAIALYKKMRFHTLGIRKNFYDLPHEDAQIMEIKLTDETK